MAKKDIAALAGLAALGALLNRRGESAKNVDESVFTGPMQAETESGQRARAIAEGLKTEGPESVGGSMRDAQDMSGIDYSAGVSRRAPRKVPKERYTATPSVPAPQADVSRGTAGADMSAYRPRYTPSALAPRVVQGRTYPPRPLITDLEPGMKRGGKVKKMASGGTTRSSASKRADGIATKGKTRGKMC